MLTWTSSERERERDHWSHLWERTETFGTEIFVSPSFLSWKVCVCVWVCVWVCVYVCALAFKGAPLLAHVSMCVCVHLSLCVVMPGPTPHERTLSDLWPFTVLQCGRSRVPECQITPRFPSPFPVVMPRVLLLDRAQLDSAGYIRELTSDRWRCVGCVSPHEFRTATRENVHFFWKRANSGTSLLVKEEGSFMLPKTVTDGGRSCLTWKTVGCISALLSPGSHLCCGCDH